MSDRRALLGGFSAFQRQKVETALGRAGLGLCLIGVALAVAYLAGAQALLVPAPVAFFLGLGIFQLTTFRYSVAMRDAKEKSAGYTTLPQPHRDELPLVSFRTGKVLRGVGEPEMTDEAYCLALANEPRHHEKSA